MVDLYFDFLDQLPVVPERTGTIVFSRKQKWSNFTRDTARDPQVRGEELKTDTKRGRLEAFSRAKTFVSYDLATFRNVEAAMAGALSVVMPIEGVSRDMWRAGSGADFQYGIAYGMEDIPWANATMGKVLPHLKAQQQRFDAQLQNFVRVVKKRWPTP